MRHLRALQQSRSRARVAREKAAKPADDAPMCAWALLDAPLRRILLAGRHLTKGRADRKGAYAAFSPPRSARARKAKPVTPA